ncbi:MAG: hypothetical protein NZL83_04045 [Candidatus Absconditabacterales bacterium]|nr:hypothetical protein [Candidatus Absconditabacterales bacterium]
MGVGVPTWLWGVTLPLQKRSRWCLGCLGTHTSTIIGNTLTDRERYGISFGHDNMSSHPGKNGILMRNDSGKHERGRDKEIFGKKLASGARNIYYFQ